MMRTFTVHSVHRTAVDVPAKTSEGHEVFGQMPALIVELVPDDPTQKTLTWVEHCPSAKAQQDALALFVEGEKVQLGAFTRVPSAAKKG
jgi:hypothetical protein